MSINLALALSLLHSLPDVYIFWMECWKCMLFLLDELYFDCFSLFRVELKPNGRSEPLRGDLMAWVEGCA